MKIAIAFIALLLTGCVSYNTMLVNQEGKTTRCAGWAFGWITPVEMAVHHNCMKKAEAAGYVEAGTPGAPDIKTSPEPVAKNSGKAAQ